MNRLLVIILRMNKVLLRNITMWKCDKSGLWYFNIYLFQQRSSKVTDTEALEERLRNCLFHILQFPIWSVHVLQGILYYKGQRVISVCPSSSFHLRWDYFVSLSFDTQEWNLVLKELNILLILVAEGVWLGGIVDLADSLRVVTLLLSCQWSWIFVGTQSFDLQPVQFIYRVKFFHGYWPVKKLEQVLGTLARHSRFEYDKLLTRICNLKLNLIEGIPDIAIKAEIK